MPYRIGIVGAGFVTQSVLVQAINELGATILSCVLDPNARALEAVNRLSPETVCTSSESDFFSMPLDAVHIATPNNLHEYYACRALELGMAVLVEKPLADTVAAGQRILQAHRRTGTTALIGYMSKHNSVNREVKSLIADGAIGRLRAMTAVSLGWRTGNWRNRRVEAGLGSLGDLAIYPVLTAIELFGAEPTSCQATSWPIGDSEQTDLYAEGTLWFDDERHLHLESSFTYHEPTPAGVSQYTVIGNAGIIQASGSWAMDGGGRAEMWSLQGHQIIRPTPINTYAEQYRLLAACARGASIPPAISLERGLHDLAILHALERSSASGGHRVYIDLDNDPGMTAIRREDNAPCEF